MHTADIIAGDVHDATVVYALGWYLRSRLSTDRRGSNLWTAPTSKENQEQQGVVIASQEVIFTYPDRQQ